MERTGWRDHRISLRHRMWGTAPTAIDIDQMIGCPDLGFVLLEYTDGKAKALIEYKHEYARPMSTRLIHKKYAALIDLCSNRVKGDIPLFIVRYTDDFRDWKIRPLNSAAAVCVNSGVDKDVYMTEREFVELLYRLHGCNPSREYFDKLFMALENRYQKAYQLQYGASET